MVSITMYVTVDFAYKISTVFKAMKILKLRGLEVASALEYNYRQKIGTITMDYYNNYNLYLITYL